MATGDQTDFLCRIKAVLPRGWFPDKTPILDGLLNGAAYSCAWLYSMLSFVQSQARRLTASGVYLDMIATDFFNGFIKRQTNESDTAFSARIGRELFREKATRNGLINALVSLTGRTPKVFEPALPSDTGGYTVGGVGYGAAGGYGSLLLPYQFFVTAYRPLGNGVANVMGYYTHAGWAGGGYGQGAIEYASTAMIAGQVTDAMIYATINDVRPVCSIAWTALSN
jgi:hypothetical protein